MVIINNHKNYTNFKIPAVTGVKLTYMTSNERQKDTITSFPFPNVQCCAKLMQKYSDTYTIKKILEFKRFSY